MIPITIALIVVQEMCARMGVVTGKGLSDLIREEFGLRITVVLMVLLVVVNYTNVVTEFIGIAGSLHLFHVTKFFSVPVCAVAGLVHGGQGQLQEHRKDLSRRLRRLHRLHLRRRALPAQLARRAQGHRHSFPERSVWRDKAYIYMAIGVVGTTIAPWMQFYLQSSIVEKGIRVKDYAASRLDVIVGSFFTDIVAWFIVVACAATLVRPRHGRHPGRLRRRRSHAPAGRRLRLRALRLRPLQRFALRRVDPAAVDRLHRLRRPGPRIRRGQKLQGGPLLLLALHRCSSSAEPLTVLVLPDAQLVNFAILSQVLNGILLPVVIILMLMLINRKDLMGEHANSRIFNVIAWLTSIVVVGLNVALIFAHH